MQLERVSVELRPRSNWEGVDLGVAMWQRWRRALLVPWLVSAVPLGVLLCIVLRGVDWAPSYDAGDGGEPMAWIAWWLGTLAPLAIALWIVTPLLQRTQLHVLSRRLFGEELTASDMLRATPGLVVRRPWLALAQRFDPRRAVSQAVTQLEGSSGSRRSERVAELASQVGGVAWLASSIGVVFQLVLNAGAFMLLLALLPAELLPDLDPLFTGELTRFEPGWLTHAVRVLWVALFCVSGPLDAAIGFGNYVNARTRLEGWDIEVAFWRLGQRVARERRRIESSAAVLCIALAFALCGGSARAQGIASDDDVKRASERVMADPEFEMWAEQTSLESEPVAFAFDWLGPLMEALLWAALIGVVVFLALFIARQAGLVSFARVAADAKDERPTHLFGLDLRPESLPDDVASAALELWRKGEAVLALGLLYRASISRLVEHDGLELHGSDTEYDCLRRARRLPNTARFECFRDVTRAWQTCAYSSSRPETDVVEQLCADWRARFEVTAA